MKLSWLNGSGSNEPDVMVHARGCRDIKRSETRQGITTTGIQDVEFDTKREAWLDYNEDFLEEGGPESAWPLTFYPCTNGLPDGGEFNIGY